MDLLKSSTDWARAEVFSTSFFIVFGVMFLLGSVSFWYLGKSDIAKSYVIPSMVAGGVLLIIGLGLCYTNITRISAFETAYNSDALAFLESEITRAESTLNEYKTVVFKAIPLILAACAIGIIFLSAPIWRASLITAVAMLVVILLVDGTAHGRIDTYHKYLLSVDKNE